MIKIRKLLCKIGFHSYQHKRIERFYPHKHLTKEYVGYRYEYGTESITHYDKCCYCGKEKNREHIKLSGCSRCVLKFPKVSEVQQPIFTAAFSGCKLKDERDEMIAKLEEHNERENNY